MGKRLVPVRGSVWQARQRRCREDALRRAGAQLPVAHGRLRAARRDRQGVLGRHRISAPRGHHKPDRRCRERRRRGQARPADAPAHGPVADGLGGHICAPLLQGEDFPGAKGEAAHADSGGHRRRNV